MKSFTTISILLALAVPAFSQSSMPTLTMVSTATSSPLSTDPSSFTLTSTSFSLYPSSSFPTAMPQSSSFPTAMPSNYNFSFPGSFPMNNISSQCLSTLNSLDNSFSNNSAGSLFTPGGNTLMGLITSGNLNDLVNVLNTDLTNVCAMVSNWTSAVNQATQSVKANCSNEIASNQWGIPGLTYMALKLYDPLTQIQLHRWFLRGKHARNLKLNHESLLLSNQTHSLHSIPKSSFLPPQTESLDNLLAYIHLNSNTRTNNNLMPMTMGTSFSSGFDLNTTQLVDIVNSIPANITCTTCNANTLGIVNNFVKNNTDLLGSNATLAVADINEAASSKCGATWSSIVNSTSSSSLKSAAVKLSSTVSYAPLVAAIIVAFVNLLLL
ncbi:hypothetical protein BC937DRAFT_91104 [Endogone sp. FLAS-F59071]|nr:hypothetical protein BC937DRAFT_91104 [Endogone sp. FLAS-F59071]|eukprot:RUS23181.1 hypothetical protein BC937DRAFT_91104 [Endogone sp. FLAS-F59071]